MYNPRDFQAQKSSEWPVAMHLMQPNAMIAILQHIFHRLVGKSCHDFIKGEIFPVDALYRTKIISLVATVPGTFGLVAKVGRILW